MRLTSKAQYNVVYDKGKAWASSFIVMKTVPNYLIYSRYGFTLSKRLGKAVVRNRVRRRLREIIHSTHVKQGWDVVFIVRPAAVTADYYRLRQAVDELVRRAHLLREEI